MSKLDVAKKIWLEDVENEEIKLIERGVPPCQAIGQAIKIISERREKKHADKSGG